MSQNILVPLSNNAYKRAKRLAEEHQQNIGEVVAEFLEQALPENGDLDIPPAEPDESVAREKSAYLSLYPTLKEQYAGQYVAIYGGELIDHDHDFGRLLSRVDEHYPDKFVWMTRIGPDPIRTIQMRSPRFAQ